MFAVIAYLKLQSLVFLCGYILFRYASNVPPAGIGTGPTGSFTSREANVKKSGLCSLNFSRSAVLAMKLLLMANFIEETLYAIVMKTIEKKNKTNEAAINIFDMYFLTPPCLFIIIKFPPCKKNYISRILYS